MKTKILTLLFSTLLFVSCNAQPSKGVEVISAQAYADKIKATENAQILDVRTPEEFAGEHLENAVNVNWNADDFTAKASAYDKSKPVFVYCKIGGRSAKAAEKLHELGFTEVYNLDGGILKWNAAGLSKPAGKIIGMTSSEYAELIRSDKKVLVNFYAEWCEPCKKMAPFMAKLPNEFDGKVKIARLNADANKTLVSELKADSLPVLLLYENGKIIWQHTGFISEDDLKKQLQ